MLAAGEQSGLNFGFDCPTSGGVGVVDDHAERVRGVAVRSARRICLVRTDISAARGYFGVLHSITNLGSKTKLFTAEFIL